MPGISGIEVCRYLRGMPPRDAPRPHHHRERAEDVEEGLLAGANDYVLKPFRSVGAAGAGARALALEVQTSGPSRTSSPAPGDRGTLSEVQAAEERAQPSGAAVPVAARATRESSGRETGDSRRGDRAPLPRLLRRRGGRELGRPASGGGSTAPRERSECAEQLRAAIAEQAMRTGRGVPAAARGRDLGPRGEPEPVRPRRGGPRHPGGRARPRTSPREAGRGQARPARRVQRQLIAW